MWPVRRCGGESGQSRVTRAGARFDGSWSTVQDFGRDLSLPRTPLQVSPGAGHAEGAAAGGPGVDLVSQAGGTEQPGPGLAVPAGDLRHGFRVIGTSWGDWEVGSDAFVLEGAV